MGTWRKEVSSERVIVSASSGDCSALSSIVSHQSRVMFVNHVPASIPVVRKGVIAQDRPRARHSWRINNPSDREPLRDSQPAQSQHAQPPTILQPARRNILFTHFAIPMPSTHLPPKPRQHLRCPRHTAQEPRCVTKIDCEKISSIRTTCHIIFYSLSSIRQ